jgi:hypothetical protein
LHHSLTPEGRNPLTRINWQEEIMQNNYHKTGHGLPVCKHVTTANEMLLDAANNIEKVFHDGAAGFTTMNHFASDIFLLTTFIKRGAWKFTEDQKL